MSSQIVKDILLRAVVDDDFLQEMLNKPESALAEYDAELTAEERQALLEKNPALLQLASTSPDESFRWHIPRICHLKIAFYEFANPAPYEHLGTLAAERAQQAVLQLNDISESLRFLEALDPSEREQRIAEILRKWEKPNAG
jgi:hypothetical protein